MKPIETEEECTLRGLSNMIDTSHKRIQQYKNILNKEEELLESLRKRYSALLKANGGEV